ncbi:MAG: hypothetical protein U0457_06900 [Candidatus Sericytochromatia bacterium]
MSTVKEITELTDYEEDCIREGKIEGEFIGIEKTAINMIKKGFDNQTINEITALSIEKIEELRKRES